MLGNTADEIIWVPTRVSVWPECVFACVLSKNKSSSGALRCTSSLTVQEENGGYFEMVKLNGNANAIEKYRIFMAR